MNRMKCLLAGLAILLTFHFSAEVFSADWPMWRYDANRSAASPEELPTDLYLQWVRQYPPLEPAWSDPLAQFDGVYQSIVMDKRLFISSSMNDSITAIDTETGEEEWRFYAEGPIRFAPVAWRDKVYVGSDDGHLYCLDAANGSIIWKFRGGPSNRKILGNRRLVSVWAIRGGPVLAEGRIYFAAGVWPVMGVFVCALDAYTGRILWKTDCGDPKWDIWGEYEGKTWERNNAFRGLVPNGYLVVAGDKLLVPSGRSGPACFDRKMGKFLYQKAGSRMRRGGGWHVSAIGDYYFNDVNAYALDTGRPVARVSDSRGMLLTKDYVLSSNGHFDISKVLTREYEREGEKRTQTYFERHKINMPGPRAKAFWAKAGSYLVGSSDNSVMTSKLATSDQETGDPWTAQIDGTPSSMIAADQKLFVVTEEGYIHCFGAKKVEPRTYTFQIRDLPSPFDRWTQTAQNILRNTNVTGGYCLLVGIGSGRLAEELLRQSHLEILAIDPDRSKVEALRRKLDAAGVYGHRISLYAGDLTSLQLPPYLANLIVSEDLTAAGFDSSCDFIQKIFYSLRPYGGLACLPIPSEEANDFDQSVKEADLANAEVKREGGFSLLVRQGPLPGAGQWTHEHANAANTRMSGDSLVKAPLGVLWYGGDIEGLTFEIKGRSLESDESGQRAEFYRPQNPRIAGGRMFLTGPEELHAVDVYTGRLLWSVPFKSHRVLGAQTSGQVIRVSTSSQPIIALQDAVYAVGGDTVLKLDPGTGQADPQFKLEGKGEWNEILASRDSLVASSGKRLFAFDRHTGGVLWKREASGGLQVNSLAVGGNKVFCLEGPSPEKVDSDKRRGIKPPPSALIALNVRTGKVLWETSTSIAESPLAHSEQNDILLLGLSAYQGADGSRLWGGRGLKIPNIIHGDTLYTQHKKGYNDGRNAGALDLLTGEKKMVPHPITGTDILWYFARSHGCGDIVGSEHLLFFRSSTAAYYDLSLDGGVTQMVGFRSSCADSMVAADGVLSSPNLSACSCNYPLFTHLAMVHDPEAEMWSHYKMSNTPEVNDAYREASGYVRRVGLNFGAPGDRRAKNGTLWLDYPSVGGWSYDVPVRTDPETPRWFLYHSSRVVQGEGLNWVQASGAMDLESVTVDLKSDNPHTYTVRVYYAEPTGDDSGNLRGIVHEKEGITAAKELKWDFDKAKMVCGIELLEELPSQK